MPNMVLSTLQTLSHLIPQQSYKEILSLFLFHIQSILVIDDSYVLIKSPLQTLT